MAVFSPLLDLLSDVSDPRRAEGKLYTLPHVLLFAIFAIVPGQAVVGQELFEPGVGELAVLIALGLGVALGDKFGLDERQGGHDPSIGGIVERDAVVLHRPFNHGF